MVQFLFNFFVKYRREKNNNYKRKFTLAITEFRMIYTLMKWLITTIINAGNKARSLIMGKVCVFGGGGGGGHSRKRINIVIFNFGISFYYSTLHL